MAIQDLQLDALVKAGIFRSRAEAVAEAIQMLFVTRPQLKLEAALQLYFDGETTRLQSNE
jgi:Arc/MetJ-type ribon-helix-helix transcriptional regulator